MRLGVASLSDATLSLTHRNTSRWNSAGPQQSVADTSSAPPSSTSLLSPPLKGQTREVRLVVFSSGRCALKWKKTKASSFSVKSSFCSEGSAPKKSGASFLQQLCLGQGGLSDGCQLLSICQRRLQTFTVTLTCRCPPETPVSCPPTMTA